MGAQGAQKTKIRNGNTPNGRSIARTINIKTGRVYTRISGDNTSHVPSVVKTIKVNTPFDINPKNISGITMKDVEAHNGGNHGARVWSSKKLPPESIMLSNGKGVNVIFAYPKHLNLSDAGTGRYASLRDEGQVNGITHVRVFEPSQLSQIMREHDSFGNGSLHVLIFDWSTPDDGLHDAIKEVRSFCEKNDGHKVRIMLIAYLPTEGLGALSEHIDIHLPKVDAIQDRHKAILEQVSILEGPQ